MSLIEATVVLGVVSMLTAVLAPAVRNYVGSAQQTAAQRGVQTIGSALVQMLTDTGELWVSRDGNGASATTPPSHASANRADLLVSDGSTPAVNTARSVGGPPDWGTAVNNTTVQKLEYYLTTNSPSNTSANAYRSATNMGVTTQYDPDGAGTYNAEHAWRGPYVPGPIGADPWGNRYRVNVQLLTPKGIQLAASSLVLGVGQRAAVFVISSGPNRILDTAFLQTADAFVAGGDDLIFRIQ